MSSLDQLKAAKGLTDVAQLVGFSPTGLAFVLYKKTPDSNYHKFEIPKRHGGNRQISAPEPQLKLIQRRLADLLQDCAEQVNAKRKFPDTISHGFKRKRSIVTNADRHRRRRFVFNVDLKDFFASINFGRVRGYFIKNRDFALDERVATILAKIACYENGLP
jgi:RNA-directed DNA polymerase